MTTETQADPATALTNKLIELIDHLIHPVWIVPSLDPAAPWPPAKGGVPGLKTKYVTTWTSPTGQEFTGTPEYIVGVKTGWDAGRAQQLTLQFPKRLYRDLTEHKDPLSIAWLKDDLNKFEAFWGREPGGIKVTEAQRRAITDLYVAMAAPYDGLRRKAEFFDGIPLVVVPEPKRTTEHHHPNDTTTQPKGEVW